MSQRHGITLSKNLREAMIEQIQSMQSQFLCRTSTRVTTHRVRTDAGTFDVCYDCRCKELVTVLPESAKGKKP